MSENSTTSGEKEENTSPKELEGTVRGATPAEAPAEAAAPQFAKEKKVLPPEEEETKPEEAAKTEAPPEEAPAEAAAKTEEAAPAEAEEEAAKTEEEAAPEEAAPAEAAKENFLFSDVSYEDNKYMHKGKQITFDNTSNDDEKKEVSRNDFYEWLLKIQPTPSKKEKKEEKEEEEEEEEKKYNNNISIQLKNNSFKNFDLIILKDEDDKYIKDLFAIDDVLNDYAYITDFKKESNNDKLTITYKKYEKGEQDNNNDKKDNKSLYKHLLDFMETNNNNSNPD